MSTEFVYFLKRLSDLYIFILGADPGPYMPNDINYWRRFDEFYNSFTESLEVMGQVFIEELGTRGIHVNTLDEAQAEIDRLAQIAQRQAQQHPQQQVRIIPQEPRMLARHVAR